MERSPTRAGAGATAAARKETQEAVILVIVSESTCELMRLRSAIYADTSAEDRKKSPRERQNGGKRNTRAYTRERKRNSRDGVEIEKGTEKTRDRVSLSLSSPLSFSLSFFC